MSCAGLHHQMELEEVSHPTEYSIFCSWAFVDMYPKEIEFLDSTLWELPLGHYQVQLIEEIEVLE